MKLNSLNELFIHELRDAYSAEHQIVKALPKMIDSANYPELRSAFEEHLEQTRTQVGRLEQIFSMLNEKAKASKCKGMDGILDEGKDMIDEDAEPASKDAGLIAAAQRVEHYEIAVYGTLRTYAEMLGNKQAAALLEETLQEEKETDERLTSIAENIVNVDAVRAAGGQARQPE